VGLGKIFIADGCLILRIARNTFGTMNPVPQQFYDQVAKELQDASPNPGIWARSFADAAGNMDKARANYIKLRALQLYNESDSVRKKTEFLTAFWVGIQKICGWVAVISFFGLYILGGGNGSLFTSWAAEHEFSFDNTFLRVIQRTLLEFLPMLVIPSLCGIICLYAEYQLKRHQRDTVTRES